MRGTGESAVAPGWKGTISSLAGVPSYRLLWLSGLLWNLTRWMAIFLGAYLVNELSGSPFLVQLVGAAFFAPMLFGGAVAGAVADRFDRRRTMLNQLAVLSVVATGMSALVVSGEARTWMVYPFMLVVGVGGVVDITSRRAMVLDLVGDARATSALALESFSSSLGNTLGALTGGLVVEFIGTGQAFGLIAVFYAGAFVSLLLVRAAPARVGVAPQSIRDDILAGARYVRGHRALISILGVTILMNLCYFSFLPLVPVVAEDLGAGAGLAGLLGSGMGMGMMVGSLALAGGGTFHRGQIYVGGSFFGLLGLAGLALAPAYWFGFAAICLAGAGVAGFATMQSALVMGAAEPAMRGRAMGALGMAIGALPIGTILVGILAEPLGAAAGIMVSVVVGVVLMVAWLAWRPESWRTR